MSLVWFITGCSSGIGLALARTVLGQGHSVVATSRNPGKNQSAVDEINAHPNGAWLKLDVTSSAAEMESAIQQAIGKFGRIDVLVNNAGYAVMGAMENIEEQVARQQWETNFWGLVRMTQVMLPHIRQQKSGTIINISSVGGMNPVPSASIYCASKFAVEGFTESLKDEVSSFNIGVHLVEPGAMRTEFQIAGNMQFAPVSPAYQDTVVASIMSRYAGMPGTQPGDPKKAALRIFELVTGSGFFKDVDAPFRLPLGSDCYDRVQKHLADVQANFDAMQQVAKSVAVD